MGVKGWEYQESTPAQEPTSFAVKMLVLLFAVGVLLGGLTLI
jgi:hypothetical protein